MRERIVTYFPSLMQSLYRYFKTHINCIYVMGFTPIENPYSNWYPTFYKLIFRSILAFPEDYKTLVPKLLHELMATVSGSFVSRLNLATSEVVPETKALAKGKNIIVVQNIMFLIFHMYCLFCLSPLCYWDGILYFAGRGFSMIYVVTDLLKEGLCSNNIATRIPNF